MLKSMRYRESEPGECGLEKNLSKKLGLLKGNVSF